MTSDTPSQINAADSAVPPGAAPLAAALSPAGDVPWWRLLNRYHWFVLVVAALGWLFDTMDQQLFNIARRPAIQKLLEPSPGVSPNGETVTAYSGYATSIFLIGWGTGGIIFGILGDLIGRVRSMIVTILLYSLFTGLSAISIG